MVISINAEEFLCGLFVYLLLEPRHLLSPMEPYRFLTFHDPKNFET
jgi:hypothetical protein